MDDPEHNNRSQELWQLIELRTRAGDDGAGAEVAVIDQRIWDRFGEDGAIMFTDLAGFSRQVARFGIIHFLQVIFEQKRLLLPIVETHGGVLIKLEADSLMILFAQPTAALRCAIAMQHACRELSASRAAEEQIVLCVGLGFGRLLRVEQDVFGHEVNLASKLGEDCAGPNEILVTLAAHAALDAEPGVTWEQVTRSYAGETLCWRVRY